jgi:hypothetical protein
MIIDGGIELEGREEGVGWPKSVIEMIKLCNLVDATGFLPKAGGLYDQEPFFIECYEKYLTARDAAIKSKT